MPAPLQYAPSPIPGLSPGETAEEYIKRLIPWMQTEFESIRDQFDQLPIMPAVFDAPRAPFTGMTLLAGLTGGWDPGAPRVTRGTIAPPAAKSAVGKTVRVRAIAYDGRGRRVNVPVTWEALGFGEIGEITGEFQATRPGLFSIVAKVAGQSVKGSATVTVAGTPAAVAVRLSVQPAHARLAPGATAKFAVQAFDLKGKPVAVRATWTATGGRITPAGVYTAGPKPGTYAVTARDPMTGLTATVAAAIAGAAPPAKASIKVDKWDWSDRLLEIRARVTVTVRGPRLKEVKLFAIERNGDDAHLDTKPCKDGAQVYVSGKYKRGKARYVEVRLYDAAGKVVATMRREAR